jgi:hypothetical protein
VKFAARAVLTRASPTTCRDGCSATPSRWPARCCFRGSMAGPHAPLSTLHERPHGRPRMTRGRCGMIFLLQWMQFVGRVHRHRRVSPLLCAPGDISSVTGPCWSIPRAIILSPVSFFCPGSALGRHLMGSDEERVGQSNNCSGEALLQCHRPGLIDRPGNAPITGYRRQQRLRVHSAHRFAAG